MCPLIYRPAIIIPSMREMGAIIEMKVDRRIVSEGVDELHGARHTLLSDRNEAVSLAIATSLLGFQLARRIFGLPCLTM